MDLPLVLLFAKLKGEANVYTMDHRGTGQSTQLKCEKTQAALSTNEIEPSQVPACAQELEEKFGDLAAFSTTSAATNLVAFISEYGNDFSTTLYGVGYGTMWVERVMRHGQRLHDFRSFG